MKRELAKNKQFDAYRALDYDLIDFRDRTITPLLRVRLVDNLRLHHVFASVLMKARCKLGAVK
jgi:hypothetical protein